MKNFNKKIRSDNANSSTVELILMMILVMGIFFMIITLSMFFANRNAMVSAAQNGARIASIYGGTAYNPIIASYGRQETCAGFGSIVAPNDIVGCTVVKALQQSRNAMGVNVRKVSCGPAKTSRIGDRVYCSITWEFKAPINWKKLKGPHTITATAESEVVVP